MQTHVGHQNSNKTISYLHFQIADTTLESVANETFDAIILPGGSGASNFVKDKNLCNLLMQQAEKERIIGAICASPVVVLEPLGLLKGKTVTCYPSMANKLKDCTHSNERVVMSENISKTYRINIVQLQAKVPRQPWSSL